jgi:hypothetical protein
MRGPSRAQDNFWLLNIRIRLGSATRRANRK